MTTNPSQTTSKCPTCKKPTEHKFRPFCSKHCKMVDLGHWLKGTYRIETEERPTADDYQNIEE